MHANYDLHPVFIWEKIGLSFCRLFFEVILSNSSPVAPNFIETIMPNKWYSMYTYSIGNYTKKRKKIPTKKYDFSQQATPNAPFSPDKTPSIL